MKVAYMGKYYKRAISLMDSSIFPRTSLDKPISNPDMNHSIGLTPVEKSDEEIVESVVSKLRKIGTTRTGKN